MNETKRTLSQVGRLLGRGLNGSATSHKWQATLLRRNYVRNLRLKSPLDRIRVIQRECTIRRFRISVSKVTQL